MTASDDRIRFLCLFDELETSRELLTSGFGHLQEIDMGGTFYHLPHQLLASGFERLMKCFIAVVRKGRDGAYPAARVVVPPLSYRNGKLLPSRIAPSSLVHLLPIPSRVVD